MNRDELKKQLIERDIPEDSYNIGDRAPVEEYCLDFYNGKWRVYFSERGKMNGLKFFDIESDACEYFYKKIISDLKGSRIID